MSIADILTFTSLVFFMAIIPGPNALLVLQTSLSQGRKQAYANILGVTLAFYIHASISAFGLSYIFSESNLAFNILKWLGVAYLLWFGATNLLGALKTKLNSSNQVSDNKEIKSLHKNFIKGLLTNLLNPKIVLFYLAIFPQFVHHSTLLKDSLVLGTLHALIVASWFVIVVSLAEQFKTLLNSPRSKARLNGVSGSLFIGFGVKLALLSR